MLPSLIPTPSPDLATAINANAAENDDITRAWWMRLLAAHLESVGGYGNLDQIYIESHDDTLYSVSTNGRALVLLSHTLALPPGRCVIPAAAARLYLRSRGWSPLGATTEGCERYPDVRAVMRAPVVPWVGLGNAPLGMDAALLDLPARVARKLKARRVYLRLLAYRPLEPVHATGTMDNFNAHIVLMPVNLDRCD